MVDPVSEAGPSEPGRRGRSPGRRRVWIFNHYADTPDRPSGTRHFNLAREVVRRGGEATIFASSFSHGEARDDRIRGLALSRVQVVDGVRFVWLRGFPYRGNDWRRVVNMLGYAVLAVLGQAGRGRPDVVVGSTVHPFAALAGLVVARLHGADFIYEVRDLWPQTLIDLGDMSSRSPGIRALAALEALLVRQASIVISVLPGMAAYLDGRGLRSDHVRYLPNGVDLRDYGPTRTLRGPEPSGLPALLADLDRRRADGKVVFAWIGSHGRVNRLDTVLEAFDTLRQRGDHRPQLLLVGDGPEKPALRELAARLGLDNVAFVDPVPKERVQDVLDHVDAGLCHYTSTPVYRYGVSFNKLFDYMAARRPIVFACQTFRDPVELSGGGWSIPPDDPAGLASTLSAIADLDPADRQRRGAAGRAFLGREHDMARIAGEFATIVGCEGAP